MNETTYVQNPFITGQPARGSDFVGRVRLLNRIKRFIDEPDTQNFAVIGKRRSGKTSLLKKVQDSYRSDELLILYFNMQKFVDSSLETLLSDIKRRLLKYSDLPEAIAEKKNFEEFLSTAFKYPVRRILLLFDEFDVVCPVNSEEAPSTVIAEFANYWLSLTEYTKEKNIPLKSIFASSRNFLRTESLCCYRLLKTCKKGTLSHLQKSSVYRILGMGDMQFRNDNVLDEFYKLTAGNPYFTQVLAHTLYESEEVQTGEKIGLRLLWRSMRKALSSFGYGAAVIWGELTPDEQSILYLITRILRKNKRANKETISEELQKSQLSLAENKIKSTLNKLEKEKFLKSDKSDNYWFLSEFFREWVKRSVKKSDLVKQYKA
jgi:hypothetical protein